MNYMREDGVIAKIFKTIYYAFITSGLWYIFSLPVILVTVYIYIASSYKIIYCALPIFGTGASTAALFYCIGKFQREGDISVMKSYWKSFKMNFKQGALLSIIDSILYIVLCTNLSHLDKFGNYSMLVEISQVAVLFQLTIITIYLYFILSRVDMSIKEMIKSAFLIGNRHITITLVCPIALTVILYLTVCFMSYLIIFIPGIYALITCYLLERVFKN